MKKGFSLMEVLIFISILGVFFVIALSVMTASLRNMQINEHKILATRYAQELEDWLLFEKERDWGGSNYVAGINSFTSNATKCGGYICTFCFNSLNWNSQQSGATPPGTCSYTYPSSEPIFKRYATFSSSNGSYISSSDVSIVVEWQEYGQTYRVPVETRFSIIE